jgi:hypothetical protein
MKNTQKIKQQTNLPHEVVKVTPKEVIDEVLVKNLGIIHPRDMTLIGSVFVKISAEKLTDKRKFRERLSKLFVKDEHVEEARLTFQKVIPFKEEPTDGNYEELTPEDLRDIINNRWEECSEARAGKFWADTYCFYVDLLGGPYMIAKISEILRMNLQVEIWDSDTASRVEYVQKYDGKVKKVKPFGFKFTDRFVSVVYEGISDRMT